MDTFPSFPHNWLASPHLENPYPLWEQARREMPMFFSPIFNLWGITRHHDVRAALLDSKRFSSAFLIRTPHGAPAEVTAVLDEAYPEVHMLVNEDPPNHTQTRNLVNKVFAPRRIQALHPHIEAITNQLIDQFIEDGRADLVSQLAYPLPTAVIGEFIGLPAADLPQIKHWTEDLIMLTSPGVAVERQMAGARGSVAFQRYLEAQIVERRQHPRDDLISALVHVRTDARPQLNMAQLISLLISVIFAGHETTTNLIGNALLQIFQQPALWSELQARPEIVDAVIEETLRIDAPVQAMFRTTAEAITLGGAQIPAGASVLLLFGAANHDDAVFTNPAHFDLQRSNNEQHLSFGRGIHFCVGAALARMETRIVLTTLAQRLTNARLAADYRPSYLPSLLHRGPQHVELEWDGARS